MAVRIEKVERDFMLASVAEARIPVLLRAEGSTLRCRIAGRTREELRLEPIDGPAIKLEPRSSVSVHFDFRGQGVAFMVKYLRTADGNLVLETPEFLYRSLSRRWSRVRPPECLKASVVPPDSELELAYPLTGNPRAVALPDLTQDLDYRDLPSLIESFKAKARRSSTEGRITIFKERGPADIAEELAAALGLIVYAPSIPGGLPAADSAAVGRIVTAAMAADYEASPAGAGAGGAGSRLSAFLAACGAQGVGAALWCPVVFYKYCVGIVALQSLGRGTALDPASIDLAWEFSCILAWFLKKHDYFARESSATRPARIVDASPKGLLLALERQGPAFDLCASLDLRLLFADRDLVCRARIARGYELGGERYYGVELLGLSSEDVSALSRCLYGAGGGANEPGGFS